MNRRAPKMPAKRAGPFYAHLTAKDSKQSPIQYKHLRFVFIIYSSPNKGPALHIVLFSRIVWSMEAALQQAAAIRPQKRICNPFTFRTRVPIWQKPFLPTPCSTCMAGKWISIYGSISLIIAHSFLSGPESTLAAEHWSAPRDGLMASNLPGRWRLFGWYYQVNSITVTVDFFILLLWACHLPFLGLHYTLAMACRGLITCVSSFLNISSYSHGGNDELIFFY